MPVVLAVEPPVLCEEGAGRGGECE